MHLTICFYLLLFIVGWLNSPEATIMTNDGNWSEAFGQLILAPLVVFLLLHAGIYYGVDMARGRSKLKSVSETRLTYIAFLLALAGVLGTLMQRADPLF